MWYEGERCKSTRTARNRFDHSVHHGPKSYSGADRLSYVAVHVVDAAASTASAVTVAIADIHRIQAARSICICSPVRLTRPAAWMYMSITNLLLDTPKNIHTA